MGWSEWVTEPRYRMMVTQAGSETIDRGYIPAAHMLPEFFNDSRPILDTILENDGGWAMDSDWGYLQFRVPHDPSGNYDTLPPYDPADGTIFEAPVGEFEARSVVLAPPWRYWIEDPVAPPGVVEGVTTRARLTPVRS